MRRLALLLALCTGCAQLFGIAQTTGAQADAPPDAPAMVSLSFQRMSVGATVVTAPQDLSTSTATYLVPDASDPTILDPTPAMLAAPDTWTAAIATGTPAVEFTLPDYPAPISRLWAFPSRDIKGLFGVLEHPSPTAMPAGSTLKFQITLPSVYNGELLQLYTLGSWNYHSFTAAESPAVGSGTMLATTIATSSLTSITGRPLEKLTTDDAVLVTRYSGNALNGLYVATPFAQSGADTLSGTMIALPADTQLNVMIDPSSVPARYAAARPTLGGLSMSWSLNAAPGYAIASNTGPQLQAASVATTSPANVTASYTNPFIARGWHTVLTWSTVESRAYTPAGLPPVTLYAGMYQLVEPTAGLALDLPAGLPNTIAIGQTALVTDGTTITIDRTKAVQLSFLADRSTNTLYQLTLYELVPNAAGTASTYQQRLGIIGTQPQFNVPADAFVAGHTYTLRAVCISGGYPSLASGDLTDRSLPIGVGYLDSAVFEVAP